MKIAIVNDMESSAFRLSYIIEHETDWEVIWVAKDGAEAVEFCQKQTPDLILMDLLMPVMDGVESTRKIMKHTPCAILVVTSGVDKNASLVFDALGYGAIDAVDMPGNDSSSIEHFKSKVKSIRKLIDDTSLPSKQEAGSARNKSSKKKSNILVAIGSSTGGPAALQAILSELPADFPAAIVIVQHVDVEYAAGLAEWLDTQTQLSVQVAKPGDWPLPGSVLVAATNDHLVFNSDSELIYSAEPKENIYRPSVDEFFASSALHWKGEVIAVLLTGMGRDGARGLLALRRLGCHTLAQDKETSAVYGMPGAAEKIGAAIRHMSPANIAKELLNQVQKLG